MSGEVDERLPVHLTPRELAARWRITVRTLDRWREAGAGPAFLRIRSRILYRSDAVLAYEQARMHPPRT